MKVSRGIFLGALACLLIGCAGPGEKGPTAAQVAVADQQIAAENTPESLRSLYRDLLLDGEREYVRNAMRLGLAAARQGDWGLSARVFDQAIRRVEAMQEGAEQAERAKSKFVPEQEKWFKGEAYERAAFYVYRGLIYLQNGDFDNAAACAKRAQLQDISTHEEDQGDWYSAEWLLALASLKGGHPDVAQEALKRAANFSSKQGVIPPPTADANVLVVAEAGDAPIKSRQGSYGERLVIQDSSCQTATLLVYPENGELQKTAAAENIYVQASTRGPRKVDYILAGKAEFKAATDVAGDAAIVAGAGTAMTSRSQTQSLVGLGLMLGGLISKGVSAASTPEADIRAWDNLPHSLYFYALKMPAGAGTVHIQALDSRGSLVKEITQKVAISGTKPIEELWLQIP